MANYEYASGNRSVRSTLGRLDEAAGAADAAREVNRAVVA